MHEDKQTPRISDPTHQDKDIRLMIVVISVASIIVVAIATALGCAYLLERYIGAHEKAQADVSPFASERQLPPEPRLQVSGLPDLERQRAHEAEQLNHYAWIDQANGKVRIPIQRAMALTVAEGLPVRSEPAPVGNPGESESQLP